MKVSDLTESERKIWQAAATGTLVDLRVGDANIDTPERESEWGTERTIRAEVIADLLIGNDEAASVAVRRVRLQGARITGELNLEATTLRCPFALLDCSFASGINLNEVTAISVRLSGSHVPSLHARQLRTHGDLQINRGFTVSSGVELIAAHIGGDLDCERSHFSNSDGPALIADRLTVEGSILCCYGFSASSEVRLRGAHIGGTLNCEGGHFSNPNGPALVADRLITDHSMFCCQGFSASSAVRLIGAHIGGDLNCEGGHFSNLNGPALVADRIIVEGSMFCREEFSATGEVILLGAHIKGVLNCDRGHFSNSNGPALNADRLTVDIAMLCRKGFSATGEVRLLGAHIGGDLDCEEGYFSNSTSHPALNAYELTVEGSMFCRKGFSATGEVILLGAHIKGALDCEGGHFSNPKGPALVADRLTVEGNMFCRKEFSATGEVILLGAHIRGNLDCEGGHFFNPDGPALVADGLTVDAAMLCRRGFSAIGEVRLLGAHIGRTLECTGGHFSNADGSALNLNGVTVSGPLVMESVMLEGILDLTSAKTNSYYDNPASWPKTLRLDRFVYDAIEGASAKQRLEWLRRNDLKYSPQIYEQLAAVYSSHGRDEDAQYILIAKQRRRFAQRNLIWRIWGYVLDGLVGFGHRTERSLLTLAGLLVLGTILFGSVYSGDFTPASKSPAPPPFQPFLYTLDLLLPVASLHQRDGWVAYGPAQWWSVGFILAGWVLATAIVLSLTGLLKRD